MKCIICKYAYSYRIERVCKNISITISIVRCDQCLTIKKNRLIIISQLTSELQVFIDNIKHGSKNAGRNRKILQR